MKLLPRRTQKSPVIAAMLGLTAASVLASSCRSATEIELNIHTNLPCTSKEQWRGVAVYLGEPGATLEQKSATLVSTECDAAGHVGSLVVAPSGAKDGVVGIRVVAGITRNPEDCDAAGYQGCIVARRTLRYTPHQSLTLDIALQKDCLGQACDPNHTCLTGGCVENQVIEATPAPAPVAPVGSSVRCGDNGVRCATSGDVCCLTVDVPNGTTQGDCRPAEMCPTTSIVLNCDDDSDCASADSDAGPSWCVLSYERRLDGNEYFTPTRVLLSLCQQTTDPLPGGGATGLALCQARDRLCIGRLPCVSDRSQSNRQLPGYFWCEIDLTTLD